MWAAAAPVAITDEQREVLKRWVRAQRTPQSLVLRARIVLMAADGHTNQAIARLLGTTRNTVLHWRKQFATQGLEGLTRVAPGRGRRPSIPAETVQLIVDLTLHGRPEGASYWSCRTMARTVGVSSDTVNRIWRAHGLQPHLVRTFKLSRDPRFWKKPVDVVGLYVNPPDHAVALSVDERRQAGQPVKRARWQSTTPNDKRNRTASLFAALHLLERIMAGQANPDHMRQEFLEFLRRLDRECSADLDLHLVLDHYSPQYQPRVRAWLERRPRFHLHFIPSGTSWLYLIESKFPPLIAKTIRRGSFGSIDDLITALHRFIDAHSGEPNALIWTAPAPSIPEPC
jgi:transposase